MKSSSSYFSFSLCSNVSSYKGGGVGIDDKTNNSKNLVVMWLVENSAEDKEKAVIHEIGHTLGLKDVFNDGKLGRPAAKFSRHNYMDYNIIRKMFFKTQIETIIDNLTSQKK
jgi:hypothetical protein